MADESFAECEQELARLNKALSELATRADEISRAIDRITHWYKIEYARVVSGQATPEVRDALKHVLFLLNHKETNEGLRPEPLPESDQHFRWKGHRDVRGTQAAVLRTEQEGLDHRP